MLIQKTVIKRELCINICIPGSNKNNMLIVFWIFFLHEDLTVKIYTASVHLVFICVCEMCIVASQ